MKKIPKYPITYKGKQYTVTLKYNSSSRSHYDVGGYQPLGSPYCNVRIYFGEKHLWTKCLYKKDIDIEMRVPASNGNVWRMHKLSYESIVKQAFDLYGDKLNLESKNNKKLEDFYNWNGNLDKN